MTDQPRPKVGVGVLIVRNGLVLMQHRKGTHGNNLWAPPGGYLEFGESFEEAARRETKEEVGIALTHVKVVGFTNDIFENDNRQTLVICLVANCDDQQTPQILEPEKCVELKWMKWNELPKELFLPTKKWKESGFDPTTVKLNPNETETLFWQC